jgi:hypothetical protein
LRIKAISFVVAVIGAVAVSGSNGAFASGPSSLCPVANFKCAISFSQTKSLADSTNPGQPSVGVGYMTFDASAIPTVFVQQLKDGVLKPIQTQTGVCTGGTSGNPGTLDFSPNGPILKFVTFNSGAELRFIDTSLNNGLTAETVGSCRQR